MKKSLLIVAVPSILIAVSMVGIGFSFVASFESDNFLGADYCSVSINGDEIDTIIVIQSGSSFYLGFEANGFESQTLSLKYVHTRGTDIILTIGFSCEVESGIQNISCFFGENMIGSTSLTGEGTKTGTIAGIVLPVGEGGTGIVDFRFQVEGIDLNTPVQMTFSVHPLEVSS